MLCDRVPDAPRDGLLLRVLSLAHQVAGRHHIDLLCLRDCGQAVPATLAPFQRCWFVERPGRQAPAHGWSPLLDWDPAGLYPRSAEVAGLLSTEIRPEDYDVIWDAGAVLFLHLPDAWSQVPVVADLVDDIVLTYRRALRRAPRWLDRLRLWKYSVVFARFERHSLQRAAVCTVVSETDALAFRSVSPSVPVEVVANGVDADYFCPGSMPPVPGRVVFEGAMAFGPNEDAAIFLVRDVMPRVWAQRPDASVALVGRSPSAALRAMASDRVIVTGEVADIRPQVRDAEVFVCPLRSGAGIKNKVLQAWAMGKAVVATSLSIGGLGACDGQQLLVRDSPQAIAQAVLLLLAEPDLRERLGSNARAVALQRFAWPGKAVQFELLLQQAVAQTHQARSAVS